MASKGFGHLPSPSLRRCEPAIEPGGGIFVCYQVAGQAPMGGPITFEDDALTVKEQSLSMKRERIVASVEGDGGGEQRDESF